MFRGHYRVFEEVSEVFFERNLGDFQRVSDTFSGMSEGLRSVMGV